MAYFWTAGPLVLALVLSASALYTLDTPDPYEEDGSLVKVVLNDVEHSTESFNELLTKGFTPQTAIWPISDDGLVHISYELTDDVSKDYIVKSTKEWEKNTCIRFHEMDPAKPKPSSYMSIYVGKSCYSYLGPFKNKGTGVSMHPSCGLAGYVHELGHALGFQHDQNRGDRDDIMVIMFENLKGGKKTYVKKVTDNYGTTSDFTSVMIYPPKGKSKNGKMTIVPKDPRWFNAFGWATVTSFMNTKLANRALKCDKAFLKKCKLTSDPCKNGGYMGPDCKCICTPGSEGENCEDYKMSYNDALLKDKFIKYEVMTKPGPVTSPNYPNSPKKRFRNLQVLRAPKCNRVVLTLEEDIHLLYRSGGKCHWDWMWFRDGVQDIVGKTYCGTELKKGQVLKSTGSDYYLYYGFYGWNYKGYKASWKYEPIPGCS